MKSVTIKDSITSPLMKLTSVGRDTLHKLDQPLKELAYVSNHWGPLLLHYGENIHSNRTN
ncbi:hypothetical protein EXA21_13380 [Vibrio cincinnatiensis]|nr:hypothetical protein [Vibrio cincinnatiensis]MCG3763829.1 hypothetical protein [Vibrio cincinnatiensis]